ncbi:MAG TPA: class I SAM-dependent methyltransferase [Kribbella sp.]|uniref:class I SAM-dependent methyltransferase n=1 Tax=Kribbella sp. TaxID=1871183 RepID=UPI002D765CB8|nr:class I SAM-dependent methyltransferase [Kribbella sp.]HET6299580.1 class I SAM-dependent methyltransferase [Kribbella sp.]
MDDSARVQRETDLVSYYNNEVRDRAVRDLPASRVERRTAYLAQLANEDLHSVLEIGSGPGRDGEAFAAAGLAYTGVDLAPESVDACHALGLDAQVASVLDLPFDDASFQAGWTMSTLLHVADEDLDSALAEIVRVLRPAAPLAVGLWGDQVGAESLWRDGTDFGPPRFFSIRTDAMVRDALQRHGTVEHWLTWQGTGPMHYQWAVLRTPA